MRTFAPRHPNPASTASAHLNSLTHGAASRQTFLRGEDPQEFFTLLEDTHRYYKPSCILHSEFVSNLTEAQWRLRRCRTPSPPSKISSTKPNPAVVAWTAADHHQLNLLLRYQTQAERTLQRALSNVRAVTKDAARSRQWEQYHDQQKQKFELQRQKFEAAQARATRLAATREAPQNHAANKEVTEIRSAKNAVSSPQELAAAAPETPNSEQTTPPTPLESESLTQNGESLTPIGGATAFNQ